MSESKCGHSFGSSAGTSRELLERAAKAAGYAITWTDYGVAEHVDRSMATLFWNPLEDDGDALRLAATLKLSVCHTLDLVPAAYGSCLVGRKPWEGGTAPIAAERYEGDSGVSRMAAVRLAIVRAAAALSDNASDSGQTTGHRADIGQTTRQFPDSGQTTRALSDNAPTVGALSDNQGRSGALSDNARTSPHSGDSGSTSG